MTNSAAKIPLPEEDWNFEPVIKSCKNGTLDKKKKRKSKSKQQQQNENELKACFIWELLRGTHNRLESGDARTKYVYELAQSLRATKQARIFCDYCDQLPLRIAAWLGQNYQVTMVAWQKLNRDVQLCLSYPMRSTEAVIDLERKPADQEPMPVTITDLEKMYITSGSDMKISPKFDTDEYLRLQKSKIIYPLPADLQVPWKAEIAPMWWWNMVVTPAIAINWAQYTPEEIGQAVAVWVKNNRGEIGPHKMQRRQDTKAWLMSLGALRIMEQIFNQDPSGQEYAAEFRRKYPNAKNRSLRELASSGIMKSREVMQLKSIPENPIWEKILTQGKKSPRSSESVRPS